VKRNFCRGVLAAVVIFAATVAADGQRPTPRRPKRPRPAPVCFDPTLACPSAATFGPHDLPFRLPADAVIWESDEFYAVVLKSVRAGDTDCDTIVPESERLEAQKLFPRRKVFSSRCVEAGNLFYTNTAPGQRLMAVYAGATRAEAERTLAAVRATGKFAGANLRRMRAGFNGT
jgi:hypothetical protein